MSKLNFLIICVLALFASACLDLSSYGVDPILQDDSVKIILKEQEQQLLQEYNNSRRYKNPVVEVDLELINKSWNTKHDILTFDFAQQVRDEFGKRIAVFEARVLRLVLQNKKDRGWYLLRQEFL